MRKEYFWVFVDKNGNPSMGWRVFKTKLAATRFRNRWIRRVGADPGSIKRFEMKAGQLVEVGRGTV